MDRFGFGIRMILFTVRVLNHFNRLNGKVLYALSLEVVEGQVGWCFEPLDVLKNVPAHPKRVGM